MLAESALTLAAPCGCRGAWLGGRSTLAKHTCDDPQPFPAPNPATGEQYRCERCDVPRDCDWVEVTGFGEAEPSYVPGHPAPCPTPRCGQVCPVCRREPGDIHSGACTFIVDKLQDPCRVTREDCMINLRVAARRKARE